MAKPILNEKQVVKITWLKTTCHFWDQDIAEISKLQSCC